MLFSMATGKPQTTTQRNLWADRLANLDMRQYATACNWHA